MTIRPLSSTESASAPLSAATADASRPTRDEVMHGLADLRPRLVECAAGGHGLVDTHVTIAPNGRVTGPSLKVLFPYSL